MAKGEYIKSKAIYTIKDLHAKTSGGTIYEHDHITIIPNDGIYDEDIPLFSESNFKYRIREEENNRKKHVNSSWVKPDGGNDNYWTIDSTISDIKSEESKIVTKPNYTTLRDFAYYGSAVELIRASVNDIIQRFPGGLYYYENDIAPTIMDSDGKEWKLISNEFNIDCWTNGPVSGEALKYPMRVLAASYKEYGLTECPKPNITGSCINSIIGEVDINGHILFIFLNERGEKYLVVEKNNTHSGETIIEPKEEYFNKFWDTLDDFQRILLNRNTKPIYKASFETPFESDEGIFYNIKSYIWPTVDKDGRIPDISTGRFQSYIQSLYSLAEFHDNYDSDNIWRSLTHEAIKNLDWTFITNTGEEINDLTDIDSSRIQAMVHVQGRIYDDIKRSASNIKSINTISYDQKNNIPDYFLSDIVENKGWESKSISSDANDNSEFLRRLALSSNYIQSMKGTRRGIETLLSMFGLFTGDYEIKEYIVKAGAFPKYCDAVTKRVLFDYVNADDNGEWDHMNGYPVAVVVDEDKTMGDAVLIPWFSKKIKYKYPLYFQSKGGWGKVKEITINRPDITNVTSISGNDLYTETSPYLHLVKDLEALISIPSVDLDEDMICYVEDITGYEYKYNGNIEDFSHYFILHDTAFSTRLGEINGGCYGWRNIRKSDIMNGTNDEGKQVIYLESMKSEERGNNPHTGKGKYDDGMEYFEYFKNIFKGDCDSGLTNETMGFELSNLIEVPQKCKFFGEYIKSDGSTDDIDDDPNSIINTKHLTIKFKTSEFITKDYIKSTILKYLYEMIPSTSIVEILFDNEETLFKPINEGKNLKLSMEAIGDSENTSYWEEDKSFYNNLKEK